jgi:tRNA (adenine37-N6)-methyltransferase
VNQFTLIVLISSTPHLGNTPQKGNNMSYSFPVIGIVHSCFKEKFGIPRQPGLAPLAKASLEILPPYNLPEAFEGLNLSSHIWLQFVFHQNGQTSWKPKVKAPRLGGNKSLGVFATRSPVRPSPIGLSVVKLDSIQQKDGKLFLEISGIDLLDGTPVLDVKPYLPYVDLVTEAHNNFAPNAPEFIKVTINSIATEFCREYKKLQGVDLATLICQILQQDPRPAYQKPDISRTYGMKLFNLDILWRYKLAENGHQIEVHEIVAMNSVQDM